MNEQLATDGDPVIRINELRAKIAAGEEITKEESAEAVRLLRSQRMASVKPAREPTLPTNLNDLFKK